MVSVTSPQTPRALPMTGVISALPVNHRVGGSLENLISKISSRVNDRRCLWGKLLSSMIRYRLNITIDLQFVITPPTGSPLKSNSMSMYFPCERNKQKEILENHYRHSHWHWKPRLFSHSGFSLEVAWQLHVPLNSAKISNKKTHLSCLVHIWLAMGLQSLYPARIPLSVRPHEVANVRN